jgi:hypothetical protein
MLKNSKFKMATKKKSILSFLIFISFKNSFTTRNLFLEKSKWPKNSKIKMLFKNKNNAANNEH